MPWCLSGKISSEKYHETIRRVAMIFQGRTDELLKLLNNQMNTYSKRMEYEKAAKIRDQIKGLEQVHEDQKMIVPDSSVSRDVIAMSSDKKIIENLKA